jgi:pentatricopeptide repeat protein
MSILKLFAFLSLASSNAFAPQQRSSQTLNHPESCVTRSVLRDAVSDDVVGINHTEASIDEVLVIPKPKLSKGKWKKKRYLMMQDVRLKIQQKSPRAPHKAAEMIRRMLTLYEKSGGDTDFLPDLQAYNLWIHALAKSKSENAGVLAEEVMEKMRMNQIWPDVITYTSVMDAHAQSQSPEMAEDVLFRLLDEAPAERLNYSSVTSDTILNALAQQGTRESAQRAQMILYRLEEWQQNDIRPTKISYSTGT